MDGSVVEVSQQADDLLGLKEMQAGPFRAPRRTSSPAPNKPGQTPHPHGTSTYAFCAHVLFAAPADGAQLLPPPENPDLSINATAFLA